MYKWCSCPFSSDGFYSCFKYPISVRSPSKYDFHESINLISMIIREPFPGICNLELRINSENVTNIKKNTSWTVITNQSILFHSNKIQILIRMFHVSKVLRKTEQTILLSRHFVPNWFVSVYSTSARVHDTSHGSLHQIRAHSESDSTLREPPEKASIWAIRWTGHWHQYSFSFHSVSTQGCAVSSRYIHG